MLVAALSVSASDEKHGSTVRQSTSNDTGTDTNTLDGNASGVVLNRRCILATSIAVSSTVVPVAAVVGKLTISITHLLVKTGAKGNAGVQKSHDVVYGLLRVIQQSGSRSTALKVEFVEHILGDECKSQGGNVSLVQASVVWLKRVHNDVVDLKTVVDSQRNILENLSDRDRVGNNPLVVQWVGETETNQDHVLGGFGHTTSGCDKFGQLRVHGSCSRHGNGGGVRSAVS